MEMGGAAIPWTSLDTLFSSLTSPIGILGVNLDEEGGAATQ